jgi:predicted porin
MKKTLVAASIAALVAAPAAFADVKISGNVIQEFISDGDDTGTNEDGLESQSAVDLVFSVSEDLGNGMSVFAKIHQLSDDGAGDQGLADQVVGIKGDFGTIVAGRMEDFSEGKVAAMAANDASDALSIEPNGAYDTARSNGGIAYVSPSMNGLTVGIAGYALDNAAGNGRNGNLDGTDIMVEYSNGPLLVRVAQEKLDSDTAGEQDQKTTSIGVQFKMGDVTLKGYQFDVDNGDFTATNDVDGYFVGADMKMGANTFAVSYAEEDNVNTVTKGTGQNKSTMFSINHALSKRTSLTAAYRSIDDNDAGADRDVTAVGIKHVF